MIASVGKIWHGVRLCALLSFLTTGSGKIWHDASRSNKRVHCHKNISKRISTRIHPRKTKFTRGQKHRGKLALKYSR